MTVDVQNLFDEDLPAGFANSPDKAKEIGVRYQMNITGEGGGEWFVDTSDSGPKVTRGTPGGADITCTVTVADFRTLYEDMDAHGMQMVFSGKLRIQGNQMLAMKLKQVFAFASG